MSTAITEARLRTLEDDARRKFGAYERARKTRAEAINQAIAEGWTAQRIADATGLSRGRVGQMMGDARRAAAA